MSSLVQYLAFYEISPSSFPGNAKNLESSSSQHLNGISYQILLNDENRKVEGFLIQFNYFWCTLLISSSSCRSRTFSIQLGFLCFQKKHGVIAWNLFVSSLVVGLSFSPRINLTSCLNMKICVILIKTRVGLRKNDIYFEIRIGNLLWQPTYFWSQYNCFYAIQQSIDSVNVQNRLIAHIFLLFL